MPARTHTPPIEVADLDQAPLLLGLTDAAPWLGLSKTTAYRAAALGTLGLPVHTVAGRMVVRREDVRRLLLGSDTPSAA